MKGINILLFPELKPFKKRELALIFPFIIIKIGVEKNE